MPILPHTLAEISRLSDNDNAVFPPPLSNAAFTLDSSGVAGFFGGDSSVAGMATVNLIPGRRWGGWYNTPGSYEIAKQYGPLANLMLCDGLFPEGEHEPARLFKLDGTEGPQFIAAHSGTNFPRTAHLGHLITSKAETMKLTRGPFAGTDGRSTMSTGVTVINLQHVPQESERPQLSNRRKHSAYFALLPILVSVGACILCALVADWFCFASIAVGIVAHGSACYVIGSGKLTFKHPKPAEHAPRGDGVLKGDRALVILVGAEGAVNAFTRGRFYLRYGTPEPSDETPAQPKEGQPGDGNDIHHPQRGSSADTGTTTVQATDLPSSSSPQSWISRICQWLSLPRQRLIGPCALLLMGQFLVQLLLIPLGTLFGQLMFITTVVASWVYNTHLSSIDREEIQTQIIFKVLRLEDNDIQKYQLSTWTATVAFTCFVLASVHPLDDPSVLLDAMLPNNTFVWRAWKQKLEAKLKDRVHFDLGADCVNLEFTEKDLDVVVDAEHRSLLRTFFDDAQNAWDAWCQVRDSEQMVALRSREDVIRS